MSWENLLPDFRRGQPLAISRLLNLVENGGPEKYQVLKTISAWTGNAYIVGLTGPPGAGKSTLTYQLARLLVQQGLSVGVICIDPTSPFTGGAFLGDRVRMAGLNNEPRVFIRSLATRGSLGGLSATAKDVVQLLDAAGKDVVLVETVGTGQVEHDIIRIADITVLITVPGLGDGIQALKAGIMEIADVFVVNKADREGAEETVKDLKMMLSEIEKQGWQPRVIKTSAARNEGVQEMWEALCLHRSYLEHSGQWAERRRNRIRTILHENITDHIITRVNQVLQTNEILLGIQRRVDEGELDLYTSAQDIADYILPKAGIGLRGGRNDG
ncbi:hypothetical protein SY88_20620 [Clostridiales bacterium PH28_bin88]|nr:hypothetical protein SY88_20620 [Clostridiales bacterium PH28_bin88]